MKAYPESSAEAAGPSACDLLKNPNILQRIQWLQKESLETWKGDKVKLMKWLEAGVHTPYHEVDGGSPLAQGQGKYGIIMPDKKGCAELLSKMQGWHEPETLNVNSYTQPSEISSEVKAKVIELHSRKS